MRVRLVLIVSALSCVTVSARAQDADEGHIQLVSVTQAHLRQMNPEPDRPASATPVLGRLAGKLLSQQFKDVRIDLGPEPASGQSAGTSSSYQGALHLNRRAEVCYDNYRLGFKKGGMALRYELSF